MSREVNHADYQSSPAAPSAHVATFERGGGVGGGASATSSSSNFENRLEEEDGDIFSPAEVRSIAAVTFDGAPIPGSEAYARGRHPMQAVARATDVNIEDDGPSVPATPAAQAQRSVRNFSSAMLTNGTAAAATAAATSSSTPGSPVRTAEQLIRRYTRLYDRGVEASYHYVAAFINPSSGETGVAQVVLGGLRDELGTKRVMTLRGEVFANPAPLRLLIKQQAVVFHLPGRPVRQHRGTVVVCGGDGTVSFLMTQLDLVRRELEVEFQPFLSLAQQQDVLRLRESSAAASSAVRDAPAHPYFTMPALAPLPLGTGNDYSNCVGFGDSFSPSGKGWCGLCGLCGCSADGGAQIAAALCDAVTAPSVCFDRWEVSLVPLRVAQAAVRSQAQAAAPDRASNTSLVSGDAAALRSPLWNRAPRPSNTANAVHHVDWAAVHSSGQCVTHGLINYLGVGFDAYVTKKFDSTRRAHPAVCSTRAQNKAVYGVMGVKGAFKCKKLRNIIPMICVPRPPLAGAGEDASEGGADHEGRDLVALQLPSMTKALVLTNVNCYSAGTHPWNPRSGEPYYRPVTLRNGDVVPAAVASAAGAAGTPSPAPVSRPVAINDRVFELQAMGGVLHYTSLGIGLSSSTKLVQTDEMFVFVLCTPDDLHFPAGQCSAYTQQYLKDKYESRIESDDGVRASLNVQIDGEAMPRIVESTIIHVRRQPGARVFVRCRNPEVVE
ncbi:diacylglycerol kinase [Novymonas esmeraldas]|uniref:diacylglycerol kinase (ATP) n=1 Tax=Novymonas esmeraldas TaxID=1808958 RepID=A0AAW0EMQ1_9TRYP